MGLLDSRLASGTSFSSVTSRTRFSSGTSGTSFSSRARDTRFSRLTFLEEENSVLSFYFLCL